MRCGGVNGDVGALDEVVDAGELEDEVVSDLVEEYESRFRSDCGALCEKIAAPQFAESSERVESSQGFNLLLRKATVRGSFDCLAARANPFLGKTVPGVSTLVAPYERKEEDRALIWNAISDDTRKVRNAGSP
ncbi:hypothetical protein M404DRAFT_29000 [Pisolithus tinctorius Marx 270]|uniref:Uncharacterized protein n=1 Tax=Pisolithus tinctorius Marx 270 TaxID=870435 RepID=A0A0C3JU85_PISTI|nr:hypothetical protein M404DRAFT_29000 [Pisolithus tinctorius Marx 270]